MPDNEKILVCLPVADAELPPARNSVVAHCDDCGRPMWLAGTGRLLRQQEGITRTICVPCVRKLSPTEVKIQEPTSEQVDEFERRLGYRPNVEDMVRRVRRELGW